MDANDQARLENEIRPPADEQEKQELEAESQAGREVFATMQTPGWQKYIEPALRERRVTLESAILGAKEHSDFIACQQAINAIDNLFQCVDAMVQLGEVAMLRLQAEGEKQD